MESTSARQARARLPGLDGLRALSISMVIFSHVVRSPGFPDLPLLKRIGPSGAFGVPVFFVISGFLITWLLLEEEEREGRFSLKGFYFRRALRILPPAFTYLAVVALAAAAAGAPLAHSDLLASAFFVRNLIGGSDLTGHYWSLAIEEQFYLCWPLLLLLTPPRRRFGVTLGLIGAIAVWRQLNVYLYGAINVSRADLRSDVLLIGALLAVVQRDEVRRAWLDRLLRDRRALLAGAALVLLAIPLHLWEAGAVGFVAWRWIQLAAVALLVKVLVEGRGGLPGRAFELPPIRWLGRISYSLYLWQQPFCFPTVNAWFQHFPVNVAAAVLMASASYYFIELPCLRVRDRLLASRRAVVTAPEPS